MKKLTCVFSALCLTAVSSNSETTPLSGDDVIVITTATGRGADTSVHGNDNKDRNYGNLPNTAVKSVQYAVKKSYFRFDLSSLPKDADVLDAQLVFHTANNHSREQTINVFGLNDGHPGEEWTEGVGGVSYSPKDGITYNNAPANNTSQAGGIVSDNIKFGGVVSSEADHLGFFTALRQSGNINGDTYYFSSNELTSFVKKDTNQLITIILTAENTQNSEDVGIASKENTRLPPPEIRIRVRL